MAITPESRMEQILNGESITPENRAEYYIKEAIDNAGSGGSLPTPGTAGNVLTSTGTAWESAAPTDNDYPVTAVLTADKVIEQVSKDTAAIKAAFDAGKKVHLVIDGSVIGAFIDLPLTEIASDDLAWFGGIISFGDTAQSYMIVQLKENDDPAYSLLDNKAPLVVDAAEGSGRAVTLTGANLSEIYAAYSADRSVYLDITLASPNDVTIRIPILHCDNDNNEIYVTYSAVVPLGQDYYNVFVEFDNSTTGSIIYSKLAVAQ